MPEQLHEPELLTAPAAEAAVQRSSTWLLRVLAAMEISVDADRTSLATLANWTREDWLAAGVAPAAAERIWAAFEIARRLPYSNRSSGTRVSGQFDVVAILGPRLAQLQHEELWALFINSNREVIDAPYRVSSGGDSSCSVEVGPLLREALRRRTASLIIAHNHPTCNAEPSPGDRAVTTNLAQACRTVDLRLDDHVIIAAGSHCSLRSEHPSLFTH